MSLACVLFYTINLLSSRNKEIEELNSQLKLRQNEVSTLNKELTTANEINEHLQKKNNHLSSEIISLGAEFIELEESQEKLIKATQFSDTEFAYVKEIIESFSPEFFFLQTHSTAGNFGSDSSFKVGISSDRRTINASIKVYWQGKVWRRNHKTSFDVKIHKKDASVEAKVQADTNADNSPDSRGLRNIEDAISNVINLE